MERDECREANPPVLQDCSYNDTKDNTLPWQVLKKRAKCTFYLCTINISVINEICNFCDWLSNNAADKESINLG